jgi:hypothetical protein
MTADGLTTVIGQLSISQGIWRNAAPNQVAVREPKAPDAPGAGKGDLFIVTEIQGEAKERGTLEQTLAETIRDNYYLARGSVTASLRRAVQAANDLLYQRNTQVGVEQRVVGGAVVLVCTQEDAFVAHIGPAAFFAVMGDHVRRYPASSIWLDEAAGYGEAEDESAMGLRKLVDPTLHHIRITAQDVLVLADSRLASQLPISDLVYAVDSGDVRAAVKKLGEVARSRDCSAIVLEVVGLEAESAGPFRVAAAPHANGVSHPKPAADKPPRPPQPEANAEEESEQTPAGRLASVFANTSVMKPLRWWDSFRGHQPKSEDEDEPEPVATPQAGARRLEAQPAPARRQAAPPLEMSKLHRSPGPKAVISTRPRPQPVEVADEDAADELDYDPFRHELGRYADETGESRPASLPGKLWRGLTAALLTLVMLLGNGLRAVLGAIIPARKQAGVQAESKPPISWRTLGFIAALIPILVVVVVSVSYIQKGRLREAEYQEFLATAQSKIDQAAAVDANSALGLMAEAETALVQAEQIKPEQTAVAEIRQQIALEVDRVGNVERFNLISPVRQYTDPGTALKRIIVQGVEIYVLDEGNDRLYHHRLSEDGKALVPDDEAKLLITARGQSVENIQVAELLDMTWMPTGGSRQTSDLVVLNSSGLLEYNTNWGITAAPLAAGETLQRPVAVDSYFGNFYVLDPQANVLLRYVPTVDGYTAAPQSYFLPGQPVDLSNAVDMAIDGAIYVLFKDGRIQKFISGQQTDFNVVGLDQPFSNPVAIFTKADEEVQHLYIADAGNRRIVQLNKDGTFVRQFKPPAGAATSFAELQGLYVDEIGSRMYLLDGNKLFLANLPAQ